MEILISDRYKNILHAVVHNYIQTAEPVGSGTVAKKYALKLSPATIRSIMAELEELGLLTQPHTSAGRIPTEMGLRYYVDTLVQIDPMSDREMEAIDELFSSTGRETNQLVKTASKFLSSASEHIGIVLAPRFSSLVLKKLEFIKLNQGLLSVILISRSGVVHNKIFETEEALSQDELNRFNLFLNEMLEGLTINQVKERIVSEQQKEKVRFDELMSKALNLSKRVFDLGLGQDDIFIQGQDKIFDYPDFSANLESLKKIFREFEEKNILIKLLDKAMSSDEVQIFIGSESEITEMAGWTVVASPYLRKSVPMGTVGVMGPTRLNYAKIIPLVDYTATVLGRILDRDEQ